MKNVKFRVENPDLRKTLLKIGLEAGHKPYDGVTEDIKNPTYYPFFFIYEGEIGFAAKDSLIDDNANLVSLEEMMIQLLKGNQKISVKLNDTYTAVVEKDGKITVGCQTFDFATVKNLVVEAEKFIDKK